MEREQRNSFRILMPPGQEEAVLLIGRKQVTARLVDASAGGFALAASQKLPIAAGDTLRLATSAGWHEVRVVRLESYADGILLGVERIRDLEDLAVAKACKTSGGVKSSSAMGGLALVCLALAAAAILMANYKRPRGEAPGPALHQHFASFLPQGRASHESSIERTQTAAEPPPGVLGRPTP